MNITLEMLMNAWLPITVFYFVYFWFVPMVGMIGNPYVRKNNCYWRGALTIVGIFHVSGILAGLLFWYLEPYMFPVQ